MPFDREDSSEEEDFGLLGLDEANFDGLETGLETQRFATLENGLDTQRLGSYPHDLPTQPLEKSAEGFQGDGVCVDQFGLPESDHENGTGLPLKAETSRNGYSEHKTDLEDSAKGPQRAGFERGQTFFSEPTRNTREVFRESERFSETEHSFSQPQFEPQHNEFHDGFFSEAEGNKTSAETHDHGEGGFQQSGFRLRDLFESGAESQSCVDRRGDAFRIEISFALQ